jgi:hypothetical protein
MGLENSEELRRILSGRTRLGLVFARHAFGMRAWVDLISPWIPEIDDPQMKTFVATLVADNARHMLIFRDRAIAHGVDPDAYICTDEGAAIYDRLAALGSLDELVGYAWGSLDHFAELLSVYAGAADAADLSAIEAVRADNDRNRAALRDMVGPDGARLAEEAHELYRMRELVEAPRYARGHV